MALDEMAWAPEFPQFGFRRLPSLLCPSHQNEGSTLRGQQFRSYQADSCRTPGNQNALILHSTLKKRRTREIK